MIPTSLDFQAVGPALVAGPSCESRPAGERQLYKSPNVMGVWYDSLGFGVWSYQDRGVFEDAASPTGQRQERFADAGVDRKAATFASRLDSQFRHAGQPRSKIIALPAWRVTPDEERSPFCHPIAVSFRAGRCRRMVNPDGSGACGASMFARRAEKGGNRRGAAAPSTESRARVAGDSDILTQPGERGCGVGND